ncbi:MAG: hypothetical protein LC099_09695 [Anaerolineales bacterium]|nr:hypothetical protein [Anaerolineales bacterium]
MSRKYFSITLALAALWIAQLACNAPSESATPDPFATLNGLYTAAAQTQEAPTTPTPGLPQPTETAVASEIPLTATNLPALPPPAQTSKCDAAQFLADVTYPDGSLVARNATFVKIWRIRNVGTCTWTTSYAVVFVSGNSLNAPAAIAMPGSVAPGQYIEIPIALTAPNQEGNYLGYWKLRNASGALFGIGAQANDAFWANIRVGGPSYVAYNFADSYCQANWSNASSALPCPGTQGDGSGYVVRLKNPVMENGATENERGLLTVPQDVRNGIIRGQFPDFKVQAGDRFRAIINCQYQAKNCNVIFRLNYFSDGQIKTLASWAEIYEGKYYPADLDLSALAGKTVKFILVVDANGGNNQDFAIWLDPHIVRQGVAPTATNTSAPTKTSTPTVAPPTATPTNPPVPTNTPAPTNTPTATPFPSDTPTPTETPVPSDTPTLTPTP